MIEWNNYLLRGERDEALNKKVLIESNVGNDMTPKETQKHLNLCITLPRPRLDHWTQS